MLNPFFCFTFLLLNVKLNFKKKNTIFQEYFCFIIKKDNFKDLYFFIIKFSRLSLKAGNCMGASFKIICYFIKRCPQKASFFIKKFGIFYFPIEILSDNTDICLIL